MYSKAEKSEHLQTIPISELEEHGYIFIREQPCRLLSAEKFANEVKYSKNPKTQKKQEEDEEDEEDEKRIRYDIVAENVFTGKEVFKGLVKGPTVEVPTVEKKLFGLVYVDNTSDRTQLLDENFQENEDIPLPVDDNPALSEDIRKRFNKGEDLSLLVITCMGRTAIVAVDDSA